MSDPAIKEAVNHEMEFSKSFMEWCLYEQQEKAIKDKIGIERYNRRIGREEGRKEGHRAGLAEGRLKEKQNTIVNSINAGLDLETIAKITNSNLKEVEAIAKRLNLI